MWFRRDLRVHDHPSLTAAVREHDRVVPVFVLDDRLLGGRFPSEPRRWFLLESLRELREALRARGGDLFVRHGPPERELPALAREAGAEAVHFASDVSPFATWRDRRTEAALREAGVVPRRHPGNFAGARCTGRRAPSACRRSSRSGRSRTRAARSRTCISARELESRAGDGEFARQLAWRDFYAHVLLHNPGNARRALRSEPSWEDDDEALAA